MPEIYVDPPQLVAAGYELADAGGGLRGLRRSAAEDAIAGIQASDACPPGLLQVIEESWARYTLALGLLEEIIQNAGVHTLAAEAHYTDTDSCSADWIGSVDV